MLWYTSWCANITIYKTGTASLGDATYLSQPCIWPLKACCLVNWYIYMFTIDITSKRLCRIRFSGLLHVCTWKYKKYVNKIIPNFKSHFLSFEPKLLHVHVHYTHPLSQYIYFYTCMHTHTCTCSLVLHVHVHYTHPLLHIHVHTHVYFYICMHTYISISFTCTCIYILSQ